MESTIFVIKDGRLGWLRALATWYLVFNATAVAAIGTIQLLVSGATLAASPALGVAVLLVVLGLPTWITVRAATRRATVLPDGIRIRGTLRTRTVRWDQINDVVLAYADTSSLARQWAIVLARTGGARPVGIRSSRSGDRAAVEANAARLRPLIRGQGVDAVPPSWPIPLRVPVPGAVAPRRRRYVVRTWAYGEMFWVAAITLLPVPSVLGVVLAVQLLSASRVAAGVALLAGVVGWGWLIAHLGRPALAVTADGLRTGFWGFGTYVPWDRVTSIEVGPTVNGSVTRLSGELTVVTRDGPVVLRGTRTWFPRVDAILLRVLAYAPRSD